MNKAQIRKLQLIQSIKHDLDPIIAFEDNQLIVEAKRTKRHEYISWLAMLLVLPVLFLSDKPSTISVSAFLLLWLTYLLYDSIAASHKVVIDLDLEEVKVYPSSHFLLKSGLYKQRKLDFDQIERTRLSDRPFGKGQPLGKCFYIQTKEQKELKLFDFRDGVSAEKLESLISELCQIRVHLK